MVDTRGNLSRADIAAITKYLVERGIEWGRCPRCGQHTVEFEEVTGVVTASGPNGPLVTGKAFPFVVLLCANCAHTQFFNAVLIGLFPEAKPDV